MSSSDRLKLIDELSLTISHQLDLREQMEIIKIIDPSANLNQQRMEFVIDLNVIDDVKLQKIQDIVNFHCVQSSDHLDNQSQASPSKKFSKYFLHKRAVSQLKNRKSKKSELPIEKIQDKNTKGAKSNEKVDKKGSFLKQHIGSIEKPSSSSNKVEGRTRLKRKVSGAGMFGFSWTRGAQRDTEDYRNGYPGKSDNQQMNLNFKFYTNKLPSTPDEQGLNWDAQELQLHEAEKLRKSSKAMKRILTSYKMMLDFYGMKLTNEEDGTIERAENWKERFQHLNRSYHNYLRITRILKCLGEFDLEHLKANFVKFVLYEGMVEGTLSNLIDSCVKYWIGVLKIDEDRDGMFDYYEKLLEEECEREKPKKKPTLEVDVPAKEKGQKGKKTSPHDGRAKVYKNEFSDEETYTLEYAINLIDSDTEENEEKGKKKATGGKSHKDHEVSDSNEELVTADKDSQEMRYWDSAETNVEHGSDEIKDDEVVGDENVTTPELEKKGEESETKGNPGCSPDKLLQQFGNQYLTNSLNVPGSVSNISAKAQYKFTNDGKKYSEINLTITPPDSIYAELFSITR
ncbi:OGRL1-like protein [Mya arenaria]|uniref:OGRL1-like protein n=1 Tax=Mya arenaria TaxID=6604 RepID=A0ABY7DXS7_MYAAR|nr:OGRL1-like protein [Mya arenaria]